MQTVYDFEIKRSGAFMTVTGKDENGEEFRRSGFYSVTTFPLQDGSAAIAACHKNTDKSVRLGNLPPREPS